MLFSRRRSKLAVAGLVVYLGLLVTAVTLFALDEFSAAETDEAREERAAAAAIEHRSGVIVIPAEVAGRCRHLDFDNLTGALREGPTNLCSGEPSTGNTTRGRMSAIRDSFGKH